MDRNCAGDEIARTGKSGDVSDPLPKSATIDGQVFNFPWIDLVSRPSEEEFLEIESSIVDIGILSPVIVTTKADVIEGHTRLIVAEKHGFKIADVPVVVIECSDEKAMTGAVVLNAVRREWTRDMRLATVKKLFALQWPQRQIARAIGTLQSQVRYDLIHLGLLSPPPATEPQASVDPVPVNGFYTPPHPIADVTIPPEPQPQGEQICSPSTTENHGPEPTESVADRRARLCQRGMDLVKSLNTCFSGLNLHERALPSLQALLAVLDDVDKGRA